MSLPADIQNDYQLIDGVEVVTYTPVGSEVDPVTVSYAKRGEVTIQQAVTFAPLGIEPEDATFEISGAELPGITPKIGHTITDADSVVFNVIQKTFNRTKNKFTFYVRKQES